MYPIYLAWMVSYIYYSNTQNVIEAATHQLDVKTNQVPSSPSSHIVVSKKNQE